MRYRLNIELKDGGTRIGNYDMEDFIPQLLHACVNDQVKPGGVSFLVIKD